MKYYKQNDEVFAYELDGSQDHLIGDKVLMTTEEIEAHINPSVVIKIPQVISMRQAREALIDAGLFTTINDIITNSNDLKLINDWEYSTEVRRDWARLILISTELGITPERLDELFLIASNI